MEPLELASMGAARRRRIAVDRRSGARPAPGHRDTLLRDLDGFLVVFGSPDGEAA